MNTVHSNYSADEFNRWIYENWMQSTTDKFVYAAGSTMDRLIDIGLNDNGAHCFIGLCSAVRSSNGWPDAIQ